MESSDARTRVTIEAKGLTMKIGLIVDIYIYIKNVKAKRRFFNSNLSKMDIIEHQTRGHVQQLEQGVGRQGRARTKMGKPAAGLEGR